MSQYLQCTNVIDWDHPAILRQARSLGSSSAPVDVARSCFEWVRDQIAHSGDFGRNPATCRASDVLLHETGFCYAKSHLLAALLRANGIPAGLCYQRLSVGDSGPPYCLHGFNAVELPEYGWYRLDARGNRAGVNAQFTPPTQKLAFPLQSAEEVEFENIFSDPLVCVVDVLQRSTTWQEIAAGLPDVTPGQFASLGLVVRRSGDLGLGDE